MSPPWLPQPNPGGQLRKFARHILQQHLVGLDISGIDRVYRGTPPEELFDPGVGATYACLVGIHVGEISETRAVFTGPTDPGGKDAHFDVELIMHHQAYDANADGPGGWEDAEDDHDRILDALKDGMRGANRDLGRPDVILQVGEWPKDGGIRSETDRPYYDGGTRDQWTTIFFTITVYMQGQP